MNFENYDNINVRVMWWKSENNGDLKDGKVVFSDSESRPFFSVNDKELNVILSGFKMLNKRRFGRA